LAKTEALKAPESVKIYLANAQTVGRGRGKNLWLNPAPGDGLLGTWSFRVPSPPQAITAPRIGLATYEALLENFPEAKFSIKAPNDIYLGDKKILGLLIETVSQADRHRLIVGIGLNVFSHPSQVKHAGHLNESVNLNKKLWLDFLKSLESQWRDALQDAMAPHLTLEQRERLLFALNKNPLLQKEYVSVSPFGDLATENQTVSWRDL